jgi:hypothetical protein
MTGTTLVPAVLLAVAFGLIVGALRCLADRLLMSALLYAVGAAAAAGVAGKIALDAL